VNFSELTEILTGMVTAGETGEWTADNKFVISGADYATYHEFDSDDDYAAFYEFDFDASTAHVVHYIYRDIPSVDAFEQVAQILINSMLGTSFMDHKITHVDIKGEYGSDKLELHQVVGEGAQLTISPKETGVSFSELTEILTGMVTAGETGEWTADNIFVISGADYATYHEFASDDDYAASYEFNFDASTVKIYHVTDFSDMPSLDEFKRIAQTYIDSWLDTTIGGYKVTYVSVAGFCESDFCEFDILSLVQMSGTGVSILNINKFDPQGDYSNNFWVFNAGTSTVGGEYLLLDESLSEDTFKQYALDLIDSKLDTIFFGYKVTYVKVTGRYGSESLVLSQKLGEDAVFERL
jgi:uncharacterized protein (DUF1330 family)